MSGESGDSESSQATNASSAVNKTKKRKKRGEFGKKGKKSKKSLQQSNNTKAKMNYKCTNFIKVTVLLRRFWQSFKIVCTYSGIYIMVHKV